MTTEQKAKAYDEALEKAKKLQKTCDSQAVVGWCEYIFPELKESKDERIRKEIIDFLWKEKIFLQEAHSSVENNPKYRFVMDAIAWLEKQGKSSDQIHYWTEEEIEPIISDYLRGAEHYGGMIGRLRCLKPKSLERQGEQKSLYIRFGDVPNNEKSKIYRGEKEIGEENGVSVYPAFEVNGNIVLGLTLPITKTTLHTQQHLLEYDDRPCYLVKGNYVGKDTDGQPLIDNVHIIRKIDSYRVKEEKVDDTNKVELKFHEGDWVILTAGEWSTTLQIVDVNTNKKLYWFNDGSYLPIVDEECLRLWTIQDAKDGDVLVASDDSVFIYAGSTDIHAKFYIALTKCGTFNLEGGNWEDKNRVHPATKEQRDLLFSKMHESGYEWDEIKKELKKIEQKFNIGDEIKTANEEPLTITKIDEI